MNKKVKFLSVLTTLALTASMGVTAFAADEGTAGGGTGNIGGTQPADNGTQVWAGVAVDAPDMRIKVTVPTLFAFVVNGTIDEQHKGEAINTTTGGLLLPNVKVTNANQAGDTAAAGDSYDLTTVGESVLKFENFSTQYSTDHYVGLDVDVTGSIRNEGSAASRNGWTHVGATPANVKEYQLVVDNQAFTSQTDGSFGMNTPIALTAPDTGYSAGSYANLNSTTNLANTGKVKEVDFSVNVGGTRGDYNKIEESAKIGTISWNVSAEASVPSTAPNPPSPPGGDTDGDV